MVVTVFCLLAFNNNNNNNHYNNLHGALTWTTFRHSALRLGSCADIVNLS